MKSYILRSLLFVPGHNERILHSAARGNADAIIIDLEDSVMPESNKAIARDLASRKIEDGLFKDRLVFVRINEEKKHYHLDAEAFAIPGVTGYVLPKVESPYDVTEFDKMVENLERARGLATSSLKIIPLIETTAAVIHAYDIAASCSRVIAMAFGSEDYLADLQGAYMPNSLTFTVPRALLAIAARAAKVIPIDTVYLDIANIDGFNFFALNSRYLGFEGTLILHPKQIPGAHKAYSPSEKEIEEAEQILKLSENAEAQDKGVAVINGKFVGPPLVKAAHKLLARHKLIQSTGKK